METLMETAHIIDINTTTRSYIQQENINNTIEYILNIKELVLEGYIFIDMNYNRWKIKTPFFNRARELWGNTNNRMLRYMELRKDSNLLHEYLLYFPNDKLIFYNFEYKIKKLASDVLSCYIKKHISKSNDKIPFYYSKLIYKLHGDFYKTKIVTDYNKVGMTLLDIDAKLLCHIMNHYEKSLIINNDIIIDTNNMNEMDIAY
jgi:hypothetical protein